MKNFFKAIGKALLYFGAFFGIQMIVSVVMGIVMSVIVMLNMDMAAVTEAQLMELLEKDIMRQATLMALISNLLSLIFIWLFFKIRKKKLFAEIELHKCNFKLLIPAILFGLSFSNLVPTVIELIPFPDSLVESFMDSHSALSEGNPVVNFIAVVFIAPVVEEIFFRGLIYTRLKRGMPIIAAAVVSSLLFGVLHGEVIWILATFLMGLMLVWVFEKTRSLLPCIAIHIANNALAQLTSNITEIPDWVGFILLGVCAVLLIGSAVYIVKQNKIEAQNTESVQL